MGLCGLPGRSATRSNFSVATAAGSRDAERAAVSVATDAGSRDANPSDPAAIRARLHA